MKALVILGALVVLAVVGLVAFDPSYQQMRQDQTYYQQQQQALQLERARLELEQERSLQGVNTGVAGVIPVLLVVLGLVGSFILVDMYRQRRAPLVRPDVRGLLPVARDELVTSSALAGQLALLNQQVQALRAVYQVPVPSHLTYSPRMMSSAGTSTQPLDPAVLPLVTAAVPSFADLLASGQVGRGSRLLLGYTNGVPLLGDWLDLYSSAVGGLPGSGKTTTVRFLAAQSALQGARFVVIDPHMHAGHESLAATLQPLSSSFLCAPAADDGAIRAAVQLVSDVVAARLAGDADRSPLLLAVDEFSRLMARSSAAPVLASLIESIAQEGRKVGVFALLAGQVWLASRSGGSELRYSLASSFVHRMNRKQANLLLPAGEGMKAEHLATGQAVLYRTSGEVCEVTIPLTTSADVEQVGRLLGMPGGSLMYANTAQASTPSQSVVSAEAVRAAGLFMTGTSPAELVYQLRGVKTSEGRKYQAALQDVLTLVREGLA